MKKIKLPLLLAVAAALFSISVNSQERSIPWPSVKQTIEGLIDTPGTEMKVQNGWTVISQTVDEKPVIWSFPPQDHYAYPSVAKREFLKDGDGWYVDTTILCEAIEEGCDQLETDFQALDKKMTEAIASGS